MRFGNRRHGVATKLLREEDRRLDLAPNHGLSWPVRLRGSPHNDIYLVGKGLPLLLPGRAEAIGQTTEIVIIVEVFRTGISCSPHVAVLGLELRGPRGGESEIVFGVLKIVLRSDRVVARVSVARQLKVSFRNMLRRAADSYVRAVRVIRTSQGVGFATAICLAAAPSVILTKWHFLSLGFHAPTGSVSELPRSGGLRGVAALRRQVSIKRPNGALSVSSRIRYDAASDPVCRIRARLARQAVA
jgi:hypothetical protein